MNRATIFALCAVTIGCVKPFKKVNPGYDASINYSGVLVNATVDATGLLATGSEDAKSKAAHALYELTRKLDQNGTCAYACMHG